MATIIQVSESYKYTMTYFCHIYTYRSEGPAQVFLIILVWMMAMFKDFARAERKKVVLSYDNMCHVDNLKVAKKPLPLPGDRIHCGWSAHMKLSPPLPCIIGDLWSDINKVIDTLHIHNHKDAKCRQVN